MSDYCRRCNGYSAEVGKPDDDGLCPYCAEIERLRDLIGEAHAALSAIDHPLCPALKAAARGNTP